VDKFEKLITTIRPQQAVSLFSFSKRLIESKMSDFISKYSLDPKRLMTIEDPLNEMIVNHFEGGLHLHSKKLLYLNLKQFYNTTHTDRLWEVMPVTYLIKKGCEDKEFLAFYEHYQQIQQQQSIANIVGSQKAKPNQINRPYNIWICKPGENSNRGNGIYIYDNLD
jgi:hypothetical protein